MEVKEYEIYIGYVEEKDEEIEMGKELLLEVRDLETFERKIVRAVLKKSYDPSSGMDKLWIKDAIENREPEPWGIKILEELDQDMVAERTDITEEDKYRLSEESRKFATSRFGGSGLATSFGKEEALKYYQYAQKKKGK